MDILCVGEMLIDFLPGGEGIYIRKPGGAPANVAVAAARLGREVAFCGCLGEDDFGHFLQDTLISEKVVPMTRFTAEATTTMAFVTLTSGGERSFTFARKPGADMLLTGKDIDACNIENFRIVHAGSCSLSAGSAAAATEYALRSAAEKGRLVSFDVNYRDTMWNGNKAAAAEAVKKILGYVDLLKISDEESDLIGGEDALKELGKRYGIRAVVETLGKDGARCYFGDEIIECKGIASHTVDTTGAGDAFWGCFLSTLLEDGVDAPALLTSGKLKKAMELGNIAGSLCVQKKGAMESLPTGEMIAAYKNS